jgi:hypothetical protein
VKLLLMIVPFGMRVTGRKNVDIASSRSQPITFG